MFEHSSRAASWWDATPHIAAYPKLQQDLDVDAVVIGGGVAGATAAYLLKKSGRRVALIERGRCGTGESGRTTAHVTAVTDTPLSKLVERLGTERARAVWAAGFTAISRIRANVRDERINCGFSWVRGCLHADADRDLGAARAELGHEAAVVASLGFNATYTDMVPGIFRPGIWFEGQAALHPLRYLSVLLDRVNGDGSFVYESSPADEIDARSLVVRVGAHRISSQFIVVATHLPLLAASGPLAPLWPLMVDVSTSYVVAGAAGAGAIAEGLYWEYREAPYEYLRIDRSEREDCVTFGGADHNGPEAAAAHDRFARLERRLTARVPGLKIEDRWSGQIVTSRDGLPYIGEVTSGLFVATGFGGNGMAFGTLAGMMACDAALGQASPWRSLFDPGRARVLPGRRDTHAAARETPVPADYLRPQADT